MLLPPPLSFTSNPPVSLTDEGESERPNKITYRLICPPCSSHPASFYSSCREQPLSSSLSFPICASGQEINKSCMQPRLNDLFHVLLVCSDTGCAGSVGKKITFLFFFQSLLKRFVPQEYLPSTESISVEASVNSRGSEGPGPGLCWVWSSFLRMWLSHTVALLRTVFRLHTSSCVQLPVIFKPRCTQIQLRGLCRCKITILCLRLSDCWIGAA